MSSLAVADINPRRSRGFELARRDGDRAFRAAVRHSRFIRFLRVAVPACVALGVVGTIAVTMLLSGPLGMLAKLPVDIGSLVVSGTKIMMQAPKVAGFTRDNRRYNMTANAAGQDLTKPDLVELHGIHATMEMKNNTTFDTTAKDGIYNSKTDQLTLTDDIVVTASSGLRVLMSEAVIDIKDSRVVSDKPVEVSTATWTIKSNRMEVLDSGDVMRFERGVDVLMLPETTASTRASADAREVRR
jgi:lipopolysaccharide export system protein LptC